MSAHTSKAATKAYIDRWSIRDFHILKVKGGNTAADVDANDPDFHAEQLPLNTGEYTITGATAGNYVLSIQDENGSELASATYTAGGGDSEADVAEGISDEIVAALAVGTDPAIGRYIEGSTYVSGDEFSIEWSDQKRRITAVLTAPGGTWLPQSATDSTGTCETWPAVAVIPHVPRGDEGVNHNVEVTVVGIDSSGDVVAPAGTYTLEFLQEVERLNDAGTLVKAIVSRGSDAGADVGTVHTVQFCGGKLGVRMHTIAGESVSVDRWEILYRAVAV